MLDLFLQGGPIMWPLLLVSFVTVTVIAERLIFIARETASRRPETVEEILDHANAGRYASAIQIGQSSKDCVARTLAYALEHRGEALATAYLRASSLELDRYQRNLPVLDTVITLAPLLGLLGTVTGMIHAFALLGQRELSAPVAITGGIAQALLATGFGLGIAIVALILFNYLTARLESARRHLEDAANLLEIQSVGQEHWMRIPSPSAKRKARIEIIPLIDIIFFLLATFVLLSLSMVKNQGITVALPQASTSSRLDTGSTVTISLAANDALYYNKTPITIDRLPGLLGDLKRRNPNPVVVLNGDEKAFFGRSIAVLDELRRQHITQISIETRARGQQ